MLVILSDNRHPHPLDTGNGCWALNKELVVGVGVGSAGLKARGIPLNRKPDAARNKKGRWGWAGRHHLSLANKSWS